ncbi:hypothetical protein [Stenotrophobium rhamnosiphilum]|uniref:Cytochrome c domain-containing protein n=1 Tax=Stenotrophobium rhamnosiphilum TaxID=2029166 RepID=A0A2T5MFD0_9GAMM|nr:hypothetical protein [Stenotrophobium rhamnosiphilum]PTU31293.1 hypothetical protein CJD38_08055 [Stenotrophobium rhamnosiphilum]
MFKKLALTMLLCAPLVAAAADSKTTNKTAPAPAAPVAVNDQIWPEAGKYPVPAAPYSATLRSISLEDLLQRDLLPMGVYKGTPQLAAKREWLDQNYYATLAARKVWHQGTGPSTHEFQGPITWDVVPIPQPAPPPCDKPQPTGYDAESCRYVNSLFKDVKDPAKAKALREQVRKGRDVWFKGTFGNQDEPYLHFSRTVPNGKADIWYPWLDTRERKTRFTKYGVINDPDCTEGDASTNWWDKCADPHSSGVLGYRKYFADPTKDSTGKVVFDPASSPYQADELKKNKRFIIGHPCVQCHVSFDPTNPPADPNSPKWENINALIGNQHINQPTMFFQGAPADSLARMALQAGRRGTIDTSLVANDFQNNPGTQNNIMDFHNRRVFTEMMKDPITGEIKPGRTQHVLKGGEDTVGDHLALIRVYVNIGMCTEECWAPNFPEPGALFGDKTSQRPFRIKQCAKDCDAWNYADAKMDDLAAFLVTGGPTYLMRAKDVDGTPGTQMIDTALVPKGRKIFARECAGCHSSLVAPENVRNDKAALERFYAGHVFGKEDYWQIEFSEAERNSPEFQAKYMGKDKSGKLRPKQFAEKDVFGQDWLGSDELTAFNIIGTNSCRALHDNHSQGHIFEEFSSEDYKKRASPGVVPQVINRMIPGLGGMKVGERKIEGGPGYLRNISLLSVWATAPFLHNNAIGEVTFLKDGKTLDASVRGRVKQFEIAYDELMMSDNPNDKPHRPQKITVTDRDFKLAPREDGQGPIKLPVAKGTPLANFTSSNPHSPLFMKCDDQVENKGHQFGISLSKDDKMALREFLKMM